MNVRRSGLSILVVMLLFAATGHDSTLGQAVDSRPDIVIVYLDDVEPHDGRLWNDSSRTPTLAALFAESGLDFPQAYGETPLCCPGRAGTLTGLHTSNHGVDANDVSLFDPSVTLATELHDVGYQTMFVGKYMNGLRTKIPRREVRSHAAGWDEFDVTYEDNGKFFDYDVWTRSGIEHRGRRPRGHATLDMRRRITTHMRNADADAPLLAFISFFHLHEPNRPIDRFVGDQRCESIEPWAPPNYNEADVSDKPAHIRSLRLIGKDAWPMRGYCEEMLGVDDVMASVVRQQRRRGRLDETLFVFTADNGSTWGTHRLRQRKGSPYATPIPLIFAWASRWGEAPRTIESAVSNIDLAPTLCAVAGCTMGPFPGGQLKADGLNLLPLLDGEVSTLGRSLIREQSGPHYPWAPEFWAIRTTAEHPLGRWHYVEYETGERELYDSVADPWELTNLSGDPAHAETETRLALELGLEFPDLEPTG